MKKLDLEEIRSRIDQIDRKLIELIEERLEIVREVALYKKENNMKIFDRKREEEVISKNLSNVKSEELKHYIEEKMTIYFDKKNYLWEMSEYNHDELIHSLTSFENFMEIIDEIRIENS